MTTVSYNLKDETGAIVATIGGTFEASDERVFRNFVSAIAQVRSTTLLARGLPAITNMKLNEKGLVFTCAPYENSDLHALLHVLRPVMLSKEASSFARVSGLLKRRFANRD